MATFMDRLSSCRRYAAHMPHKDAERAIAAFQKWLLLNDIETASSAIELLEDTNYNPNIAPLPTESEAEEESWKCRAAEKSTPDGPIECGYPSCNCYPESHRPDPEATGVPKPSKPPRNTSHGFGIHNHPYRR